MPSLRTEIIAIGDELLSGYTVNSNGALISRRLGEIGIVPTSHRVVPDARGEALEEALKGNDLVICSGGLGPTLDDSTRQVVAELLGDQLIFHEEVARRLGPISTQKDQATIPSRATPIFNRVGTAPGLIFELENVVLILLPGVPIEMEAMLDDVLPLLQKRFPSPLQAKRTLHIYQVPEVTIDQTLREIASPNLAIGIYPHLGVVTVRFFAEKEEDLEAPLAKLTKAYPNHFFEESIEVAVQERCIAKDLTLGTAESCTGGEIAGSLTKIPGASNYFLGSIISYANPVKEQVLHVTSLPKVGAVSQEVAEEMLSGLFDQIPCDVGVAVTGIAGPSGGTEEKPVGTVWTAAGRRGEEPHLSLIQARGNRAAIIQRTRYHALAEILKLLK